MSGREMARRLAELGGELDLLFTDELWAERAAAGLDEDGPENVQSHVGEASAALQWAVLRLEGDL
jgi:hypothetical protein